MSWRKSSLEKHDYENALELLSDAENYPENYGEGKLHGAQENDIHFLRGCAYEGMGNQEEAERWFTAATRGLGTPVQAIYYNDQQPDKIFYQGLAWRKLGSLRQAEQIFRRLIEFGEAHMNDKIKIDYFAVSLPDLLVFDQDLDQRNRNHCNYLIGLGCLGLGTGFIGKAIGHFKEVLKHDLNHFGAEVHLKMAEKSLSSLTKRDKGRKN